MVKKVMMLTAALSAPSAYSSAFFMQAGSTSVGSGGPNSLGIPPRITDLGFTYMTDDHMEYNLNISGITALKRHYLENRMFLGLGGGLVFSTNGTGPGISSLFGWELFKTSNGFSGSIEYSQSVGLSFGGNIISPYIVRLGGGIWW